MLCVAGTGDVLQDHQNIFREGLVVHLKSAIQFGKPPESDSLEGHSFFSPPSWIYGKIILLLLEWSCQLKGFKEHPLPHPPPKLSSLIQTAWARLSDCA